MNILGPGSVWAFTALAIVVLVATFYFAIFFAILYIIGWGLSKIIKPIISIMTYDGPH